MFGLFKSEAFVDPQLGTRMRSRGFWRGTISVGSGASVLLAVAGTRSAPDPSGRGVPGALWKHIDSVNTAPDSLIGRSYG